MEEEKWLVVRKEQSSPETDPLDFDMFSIILPILMMVGMMAVLMPMSQQVSQSLRAQAYVGNEDPRIVNVTSHLSWINLVYDYPYQPWFSAYFINDGPSAVEVGINYPDDTFTMKSKETITVSRSGAEERIRIIFFKCSPGLTATLRVTGVY